MADRNFSNDGLTEINRKEHEAKSLESKRVTILAYIPGTDTPVRVSAVDNGDGTYSMQMGGYSDYRFSGGKTAYVTTLAAAGESTLIDPAPGKRIRIYWIAFVPNSDNTAANLIKLGFGSGTAVTNELYRGYALAHWEVFTGAADQNFNVEASTNQPVAITVHYGEIT